MIMLIITSSFEKTSIELKLAENDRQSFRQERLGIAVLRATVATISEIGANHLYYFAGNLPTDVPINFFEDDQVSSIKGFKIRSLDRFFYINHINLNFRSDVVLGQISIFRNILEQFPSSENREFESSYINNFIGELADWVDQDSNVTGENFLIGQEYYPNAQPLFTIKNAPIDVLSEILLIPSFHKMNILEDDQTIFDLPLRVAKLNNPDSQCDIGPINLNMLPPDKKKAEQIILQYINWSQGINLNQCGYRLMYENRFRLAESIGTFVHKKITPPYQTPINQDQNWDSQVNLLGEQNAKSKFLGLFSAKSNLVEINFIILDGANEISYKAHLRLIYPTKDASKPITTKIIYFSKSGDQV